MPVHVEYYLSLASPWAYLGHARFEKMAQQHGATVAYRPVSFAQIFAATGGLPLHQRPPQRQAYRLMELKRWRDRLGVPLNLHPRYFPVDDTLAALTVLAAEHARAPVGALIGEILRTVWVDESNIADAETLRGLLRRLQLDTALVDKANDPAFKAKRDAYTEQAIDKGVFGAPSFVIDDEIFWGQDRLDFVQRRLAQAA